MRVRRKVTSPVFFILPFLCVSCGKSPVAFRPASQAVKGVQIFSSVKRGEILPFLEQSISFVNETQNGNYVFSPISYYLSVGVSTVLQRDDEASLTALKASSVEELKGIIASIVGEIEFTPQKYERGYSPVCKPSNLVVDHQLFLRDFEIEELTNELGTSYIGNQGDNGEEESRLVDSWIRDISYGEIETPASMRTLDFGLDYFYGGIYFDMPFSQRFDQAMDKKGPFNGKGSFTFFSRELVPSYSLVNDEFAAIELPFAQEGYAIRFVMPKRQELKEFFSSRSFASCFESTNMDEGYSREKCALRVPGFDVDSSIDLKETTLKQGFSEVVQFPSCGSPSDLVEIKQSNTLSLTRGGVRAYSFTSSVYFETSAPMYDLWLDHSFAYEVVSPSKLPIFHGVLVSLD